MSRSVPIPFFPIPPREYTPAYMSEVVRAFAVYAEQMNVPGPWRATTLTLTNVPSVDTALPVGGVFEVDGVLKIARAHNPHPAGGVATSTVGVVQVTIT